MLIDPVAPTSAKRQSAAASQKNSTSLWCTAQHHRQEGSLEMIEGPAKPRACVHKQRKTESVHCGKGRNLREGKAGTEQRAWKWKSLWQCARRPRVSQISY